MEVFHADAETHVHSLPVSWCFNSYLLSNNLCSCTHIMSILFSIEDTVSSDSWFIVFKVLALHLAIFSMVFNLSIYIYIYIRAQMDSI